MLKDQNMPDMVIRPSIRHRAQHLQKKVTVIEDCTRAGLTAYLEWGQVGIDPGVLQKKVHTLPRLKRCMSERSALLSSPLMSWIILDDDVPAHLQHLQMFIEKSQRAFVCNTHI